MALATCVTCGKIFDPEKTRLRFCCSQECEVKRNETTLKQGHKFDVGKPRFDLIPPDALTELARLYAMGANKYDDNNWLKGMMYSRIFAALMRHATAFWAGEEFDEDGQHHLDSVVWCGLALRTFQLRRAVYHQYDDRYIITGPNLKAQMDEMKKSIELTEKELTNDPVTHHD